MVHITYEELKTFDKEKWLDNLFDYEKIDNTINYSGFWVCGIKKSNFEIYNDGRIILRFYDKNNLNIAGINLFPHQEIKIDLNTGMIDISTIKISNDKAKKPSCEICSFYEICALVDFNESEEIACVGCSCGDGWECRRNGVNGICGNYEEKIDVD